MPVLAGALVLGAALRVLRFAGWQSLYIDEARLALNIAGRSYGGLLGRLDYDQSAPPMFLWAEKLVTQLAGVSDLGLRVLPLLAGLAAMFLVYPVARQFVTRGAAVLAAAMIAVAPAFVNYSSQIKQYTLESAVTLLLVWTALRARAGGASALQAPPMLIAVLAAPWLSAPSVFVVGAIVGGLLLEALGDRRYLRPALTVALAGGASFAAVYFLAYSSASNNAYLDQFWHATFLTPWGPGFGHKVVEAAYEVPVGLLTGWPNIPFFTNDHLYSLMVVAAALTALWAVGIARTFRGMGPLHGTLLFGPLLLVLGGSAVGVYPFASRTMLFAAPLLLIGAAAGVQELWRQSGAFTRGLLAMAVLSALVVLPLLWSSGLVIHRDGLEHLRPLVSRFQRIARPGEPVYVFAGSIPAWTFYTTDWERPDTARLAVMARSGSWGGEGFENAAPRAAPIEKLGPPPETLHLGHPEILGLYSGMQWRTGLRGARPRPDVGWLRAETERVRLYARPDVWLVFSHAYGPELFLARGLGRLGGKRIYEERTPGAYLFKYRFPARGP